MEFLNFLQPEFTEKLHFYLSALSYLAGTGSGTIIPDPDPGKVPDPCGSGSTTPVSRRCYLVSLSILWQIQLSKISTELFFKNVKPYHVYVEQKEFFSITI